jgi:hypothetical protein
MLEEVMILMDERRPDPKKREFSSFFRPICKLAADGLWSKATRQNVSRADAEAKRLLACSKCGAGILSSDIVRWGIS